MVECYKKIVCLGKTNWTLCSVLFGLLSTKGTTTKKSTTEVQQKTHHWLVEGEAARYRYQQLQISPIHHTDISSAVC